MADKKKVYKIVINGLSESVDMAKSLQAELDKLDKQIDKLDGRKIKITGEVETNATESKTVVSGATGSSSAEKEKLSDKELAIQKQITAEKKAQAQLDAMQTSEYQESYQALSQTKEQIKQAKQELDAMASGAATLTAKGIEYSNTMKGMKAELKALKQERDGLDLAKPEEVERFKEIQERALELETLLKSIESEAGVFSRNVGNYPQLLKQATTEWDNAQKIIETLSEKLAKMTPGTEGYDKLKSELEQAEKYAQRLDERLSDIKKNIGEVNNTGIKIDVGGKEREFNSLKDAVKTLTKELQEMTLAGETNTEEFEATIKALGRVKTAISSVSSEMQSYIGNAKGLSDTIEIMQGMTSIASLGAGLQQLFGGTNEELDEMLKKFTGITLVVQGLENIKKSFNDPNSIFGNALSKSFNYLKDFISSIPLVGTAIDSVSGKTAKWHDNLEKVSQIKKNLENFEPLAKEFDSLIRQSDELKDKWDSLSASQKVMAEVMSTMAFDDTGGLEVANFDGLDDEKLKDFLNTLQQIKDINPELAASFRKLATEIQTNGKSVNQATAAMQNMPKWMKNAAASGGLLSKALVGVSGAAKVAAASIKGLLASTVILLAVQVIIETIIKTVEALGSAWNWMSSHVASLFGSVGAAADQTKDNVEYLAASIEQVNDRLSEYNKQVDRMQKAGAVNSIDAMALKMERLREEISQTGKETQTFINSVDNLDTALDKNLGASVAWYKSSLKNVDEVIKRWHQLKAAVEAGTDVVQQGGSGWGWWETASDAVDDFTDANKAMLQDLAHEINSIDFSKPEEAIKKFDKLFEGQIGDMRDYAVRNIDKMFPDEPWAQMLNARLDQMKQFVESYKDLLAQTTDDSAALLKQAEKAIRDNNAAALPKNQREDTQSKNARADEIEAARKAGYDTETLRRLEASINAKYDRQDKERREARVKSVKKTGDDEYNILKQIRNNQLALQKEGLDKEIKQLENAMADELHSAEKATKHRGELILSIQKKYQKLIEDKRTEWYKNLKKQQEVWNKEWKKMMEDSAAELAEIQNAASLNNLNRKMDQAENDNVKRTSTISYDTSIDTSSMGLDQLPELLKQQKQYYQNMLKAQSDYIAEKTRLQLEESNENQRILEEQAEREYNTHLQSNKEWQEAQLEQQNEAVKKGLVTEEEYQENLLAIANSYQQANTDAYETYQIKLSEATKNGEQERKNIITQGRQEQQQKNGEANQKDIQSIQDMYNEIADIADREQKANTNRHTGLFNYSKEKERLEKTKKVYDDLMQDLETQYEKLKQQLNDGEIDFDQFKEGKKQIETLKKQMQQAGKEIAESQADLFQTWAGTVNDYAQKVGQQIQSMFSTFTEIMSLKLDAEEAALDREQELLDKEKDMVEKAYDKQADIVQRYKDAINDTEDELKSARGERRLALLDGLAQQREGYLQETEALKKQELEKEKIAKKEQALKDKQDKLEKKRKQQQQKASIINATINTALGVTQALASWPPPASYALAAAVGALGAVEIALIASQKYAKGGVIEGPAHSQGGVKVLGGRAEVEGGEFITDKATTGKNTDLLYFINMKKRRLNLDDFIEFYSGKGKSIRTANHRKFATGGEMPELTDFSNYEAERPITVDLTIDSKVSTVDIVNAIDRLTQTRVLAGL